MTDLPEITAVTRLDIRPGDRIVITAPERLTYAQVDEIGLDAETVAGARTRTALTAMGWTPPGDPAQAGPEPAAETPPARDPASTTTCTTDRTWTRTVQPKAAPFGFGRW